MKEIDFFRYWKSKIVFCTLAAVAAYFDDSLPPQLRVLGIIFLLLVVFVGDVWAQRSKSKSNEDGEVDE